ncbi:MAG: zinc-ribbon domain-containing protein [Chloroflexales bacterium]|nr:zinc-ribbon domain-containing protein [Chloroflexales bacterium]
MSTCPTCGTAIAENDRFCPQCGTRIEAASTPDPAAPADRPDGAERSEPEAPSASGAPAPVEQPAFTEHPEPTASPAGGASSAAPAPGERPESPEHLEPVALTTSADSSAAPAQRPEPVTSAPSESATVPLGTSAYQGDTSPAWSTLPPAQPSSLPHDSATLSSTHPLGMPAGLSPATLSAPPAQSPKSNRLLWVFIIGGIGCLSVLLLVACLGLAFLFMTVAPTTTTQIPPVISFETPRSSERLPDRGVATAEGKVLLEETFTNPASSRLGENEDADVRSTFVDGTYEIQVKTPELITWNTVEGVYDNVAIQVETTLIEGSETALGGLIFRYQDSQNFYLFSVANDGFYRLEILKNDEWLTLIDWTPTDAIVPAGNSNTIRVETRGSRITLVVNDVWLEETVDSTFTDGAAALAVGTFEDGGATIQFDNLMITSIE